MPFAPSNCRSFSLAVALTAVSVSLSARAQPVAAPEPSPSDGAPPAPPVAAEPAPGATEPAGPEPAVEPAPAASAPPAVAPAPATPVVLPAESKAEPSNAEPSKAEPKPAPSKMEEAGEAARDGEALAWVTDHFFGKIKVRGYTQFRLNQPTSNSELVNLQGDKSMGGDGGFFIRRARMIFYGDVHPLIYVYLQPDFASSSDSGNHYVQLRDWYVDLSAPGKEFRIRLGQSKVPFGFENMQSSQNRLPLDRSDALNSAVSNERDLGAFFYWAPTEIRDRFTYLVKSGLKGSGDYGVFALGVYNGQTANKPEKNDNKHVVSRLTYPFLLGKQIVEVGAAGYIGKYVVSMDDGFSGPDGTDEFMDARGNFSFTLYPQPFGLQFEYNAGVGPEITELDVDDTGDEPVYSGLVEEEFLHGGYLLLSYKADTKKLGTIIPYSRGIYYEGGKKHEANAPKYSIREVETGIEWQPIPALEIVTAFTAARRTAAEAPYQSEEGFLGRFQVQVNY